jgi:hypothetical protein
VIALNDLTPQHGRDFHNIYIVDDKGYAVKISPNWMPPFVAPDIGVTLTKTLDVRVQQCDAATVLLAKSQNQTTIMRRHRARLGAKADMSGIERGEPGAIKWFELVIAENPREAFAYLVAADLAISRRVGIEWRKPDDPAVVMYRTTVAAR